jgi:DNA-binding XRE family transcriptional regulator
MSVNTSPWRESFKDLISNNDESAIALQGFRHREGMTQAHLGKLIGVHQANISLMEKGKRAIGKNLAKRLAEIFKTDYRVFL